MKDKKNIVSIKSSSGKQTQFRVTEPMELMAFLQLKLPAKARTAIKSILAHKQVSVNNKVVSQYNYMLSEGNEVSVNSQKPPKEVKLKGLDIIFEDEHIIVVKKVHGLLSISTNKKGDTTAYGLLSQYVKDSDPANHIYVLHRLDRETSGIMMFAKTPEAKQALQTDWQESVMERCYYVVVEGIVEADKGTIVSWLTENKNFLVFSTPHDNGGQKATTHYKVLQRLKNYSLVEVKLETGRKNQIRVHMQDIGHPVVGDKKYGATRNPINRLGLHAFLLVFKHPFTGEIMRFETGVPDEFNKLFRRDLESPLIV
jgi:23S rRNA pseudouridine1911/1915/1917 synthase